ncbi:glutamate racemase [Pasteurellaceae bacterium LIM206]|nr:glutamate racemase [Pasteurellaceae bacterium LIM206]
MKPTVLFYDSGMGGLSVYREVYKLLPELHYLYCFDNAFFPYSEKDGETLIRRALQICQAVNRRYPLDMIVVACNTASTVVLPALRQAFDIPIVGTVPPIKPAAEQSSTKHIGLLATKGTIKRPYVDKLIADYARGVKVEKIGSTKLAEIAELKLHGHSVDLLALRKELAPWIGLAELDSVILGCTHFPLIKEEIEMCLPQVKRFYDPGPPIAKRVKHLLETIRPKVKNEEKANLIFCTKHFELEHKFQQVINFWGFNRLELLNID